METQLFQWLDFFSPFNILMVSCVNSLLIMFQFRFQRFYPIQSDWIESKRIHFRILTVVVNVWNEHIEIFFILFLECDLFWLHSVRANELTSFWSCRDFFHQIVFLRFVDKLFSLLMHELIHIALTGLEWVEIARKPFSNQFSQSEWHRNVSFRQLAR